MDNQQFLQSIGVTDADTQAKFLDIIAQAIAEREHIYSSVSLDALARLCNYYTQPAELTALDLYFYLRSGDASRAMVHQFRENVRMTIHESLLSES